MPSLQPTKPPLVVYRAMWAAGGNSLTPAVFAILDNRQSPFANLAEARSYAAKEGYRGIKVKYV